jgi:lysophospholipase L1-like esterase
VLVTSIVRRAFTDDGKIKRDGLVPYVEVVRELGAAERVPLIDLYALTLAQAEKLGSEGCAEIDARLPDGKRDQTHLGPRGRQEIGRMAAAGIRQADAGDAELRRRTGTALGELR